MSVEHHGSVFDPNTQKQLAQETKGGNVSLALEAVQIFRAERDLIRLRRRENNAQTRFSDVEQDEMAILHGEHARILGDKSRFPGLVRDIGYKAPDSYLIRTDQIPPHQRGQVALDYYQNPEREARGDKITRLFVKPLNGAWRRDLADFDTATEEGKDALNDYLGKVSEYTLVQEFMPHEKWLRYMRYQNKKGYVNVACFEFVEDESPTSKRVNIPYFGRKWQYKAQGVNLNELLTSLRNTSGVPLDNTDRQLNNLNGFMDEFSKALETKLGGAVPLLSVDLGIYDMQQLGGKYDFERMKNTVAFFETQSISQSWETKIYPIPHPVKTYIHFWKAFMQEHGKDVVARAKALKNSMSQKEKTP